jgi:hypothetical protein
MAETRRADFISAVNFVFIISVFLLVRFQARKAAAARAQKMAHPARMKGQGLRRLWFVVDSGRPWRAFVTIGV